MSIREVGIREIYDLVDEALAIFPNTSVFEVIDLDKPAAIEVLTNAYENGEAEEFNRYLDVIERLKWSYSQKWCFKLEDTLS